MLDNGSIIAIVIIILACACILLLFHHAYVHRRGSAQPLEGCDQWFQQSDVCNCHSCNHEMWILGIELLAVILAVILSVYVLAAHVFV
jgi:hypothetical protein